MEAKYVELFNISAKLVLLNILFLIDQTKIIDPKAYIYVKKQRATSSIICKLQSKNKNLHISITIYIHNPLKQDSTKSYANEDYTCFSLS
jgi:hypothetical protein